MAKTDKESNNFDYGVFKSPFSRPEKPIPVAMIVQSPHLHSSAGRKPKPSGQADTKLPAAVMLPKFCQKMKQSQKGPWCWNCKDLSHDRSQCPLLLDKGVVNHTAFIASMTTKDADN